MALNYRALYRKYRPLDFDSVVGQDHIVTTLKNQLLSGRIPHAYLFCGTRGTGKTSVAKIFARAVNCENLINGNPDNECKMCLSALDGTGLNVVEIDAASNTGVDNIRELREEVKYPPTEGKYKVYIIDEVHMLSGGAFNALLKTLEEPPAHVIFILATTDPQKIPITILSRCQRFDFKRISSSEIAKTLRVYMDKEGINITDDALDIISKLADGSMRDSLSILEQCVSFYMNEEITLEKVLETTSSVDNSILFDMADSLFMLDTKRGLEIINEMLMQGRNINQFVLEFINHLRNLMIAKTAGNNDILLETTKETAQKYFEQSQKTSVEELIYFVNKFSELLSEMRYARDPRILLEVLVIKLSSFADSDNLEAVSAKVNALLRNLENGTYNVSLPEIPKFEKVIEQDKKEERKVAIQKATPEDIKEIIKNFDSFTKSLTMPLRGKLKTGKPVYMDNNAITILGYDALIDLLKDKADIISESINNYFKKEIPVRFVTNDEYRIWKIENYGTEDLVNDYDEIENISSLLPDANVIKN